MKSVFLGGIPDFMLNFACQYDESSNEEEKNTNKDMSKKQTIMLSVAVAAVLVAIIGFLAFRMQRQNIKNQQMLELAEMDKREMENEYEQFAMQYNEMKMKINNDSLVAQLEQEQQRTEELLEELKRVKSSDAAEIMRLKKELATLRKVLRSYVLQIDSLNRMNQELTQENSNLKNQNRQAQQHISSSYVHEEEEPQRWPYESIRRTYQEVRLWSSHQSSSCWPHESCWHR